jgi:NarL family two-component system response regulator LiaR
MQFMVKDKIRVLVADDHLVIRKGIRALFSQFDDIELVGQASDGWETIELFKKCKPDVVLMDLVMPNLGGIEATRIITSEDPGARILILTSFIHDESLFPAIQAGALGYILKDANPKDLVESIRQVYQGQPSLDPTIAQKVLSAFNSPSMEHLAQCALTERESEVLILLAQGLESKQIAERLLIADVTVCSHICHILDKLHLSNRIQAGLYALRKGTVDLDIEMEV